MLDPQVMPERLERFLAREMPSFQGARVVDYRPLPGGYSRLMARFTVERGGIATQYVLRGDPPPGQSLLVSDRRDEWHLLRALETGSNVSAPRARCFDPEGTALGTPALVIDWLEGRSLVERLHGVDDDRMLSAATITLADLAATVHATDLRALPARLRTSEGWEQYVDGRMTILAALDDASGGSDPLLRYVRIQLGRHRPPPVPLTLIHGDLQIPNVIVGDDASWSLVDWERARVGDPREDLGTWCLAAAATPPDLIGRDEQAFCARYRERSGLSEAAINPATIAYFTILGTIDGYRDMLAKVQAYGRGEIDGTMSAYLPNILTLMRTTYYAAARRLASDSIGASR